MLETWGEAENMSQYENMVKRQRKWMLYLLSILVLGAALTPYKHIFFGLLLGSTVSFYNLYLLQRKIDDFSEAVVKQTRPKGLGMISRFAAAALAVILAIRFKEHVDMIAVIIGLMTSYLVIMLDFIFYRSKE
ncbi:ATP synthase subunit I [Ornithinibacillus gellani]|uniref:ATP synthase subunit I n=1 Tax=Ornithinibacillus gellani TaxID=2293253 RepID=UPI001CC1C289|nr:ATP synthase subunit I [Ornithinibacillus gellani]